MRILLAFAMLAVIGCAPLQQQDQPAGPGAPQVAIEKPVPASTQSACLAQGGDWAPICRLQRPACVLKFADAGKACTDSDQCQGACYANPEGGASQAGKAVAGACSVNSNPCGCNARVEDGIALPTLCVD
ncbi:MAG TPA: hypothetical protein VIA80_05010 [Hyphomonadaceae bacterium]|jgi:hypothetical protein